MSHTPSGKHDSHLLTLTVHVFTNHTFQQYEFHHTLQMAEPAQVYCFLDAV